jgi:hypothetical protein
VDKKFNIKDQLAGIAALIAAIVAIGGGFVKYGEVMTKLDVLTKASKTVDKVSIEMVAVLQEKVKKLENKKDVVVDLSDLELNISGITEGLSQTKIKSLVNSKEIELLKIQIDEIKIKASNPLAN